MEFEKELGTPSLFMTPAQEHYNFTVEAFGNDLKFEKEGRSSYAIPTGDLKKSKEPKGISVETNSQKKRIIIVEDDQDLLYLMVNILSDRGYEVLGMPNGTGIVEGFCKWPDLFILDNNMDFVTGEEITKYLRLQANGKDIPIVMISGEDGDLIASRSGANYFMAKPFNVNKLLAVVDRYLNPSSSIKEIKRYKA